jgi:hypothetical protein
MLVVEELVALVPPDGQILDSPASMDKILYLEHL